MIVPPLIRKIEPGDVIGRCRAIRELGRGGVGTVFLATHQTLQIEVALKVLNASLSMENPSLAERFIREAQLAARIRHPNVIAVMDAAHDETTGLYFIVMEYVGGGSLSWHLRHGPLPEAKALGIVTGIAHALVIAEESRIVHRDIKPDNIMLDLRGTAKLADLGLAKHSLDSRLSLTMGGTFMGTPAYMSPEQARDAKIADTRDDIYSLGASFYECLTGQPPFQGETPYNIMSELLTKPSPQPRLLRPELSRSADLICRKMMAKSRDLRYADARALLADLHHAQLYGDAGLDRLEAASFEHDAAAKQSQATDYGVESTDGIQERPRPSRSRPSPTRTPTLSAPRRSDRGVFVAAGWLIALVTAATLMLAYTNNHPLAFLRKEFAQSPAAPIPVPAPEKPVDKIESHAAPGEHPATSVPEETPHPAPVEPVATDLVPTLPPGVQPATTSTVPVALPANPADFTNAIPAVPADVTMPGDVVPAASTIPDSAFVARSVAENSLDPAQLPTGHAELLRIIGKRDPTQISPTAWTFYFYDKSATGNARIVTVSRGKVTKSSEDFDPIDIASPYDERLVLPEEKLMVDSPQALQIAQSQVPGVAVTSSEFILLQQKNSVPMWKVSLWNRNSEGESHRLGDVTILAENGFPISKNLKP